MYIERDLKTKFDKISSVYKIVAITGARQAGKTTFLKHQLNETEWKKNYVSFDDPDAKALFEEDIKKFENQYINEGITILDEVQYCKDPGLKLKYLADKGHKLWITSSSETILSSEVLSYLVGRVSILNMYPFSFSEFLRAKGHKEITKQILKRNLFESCVFGNYPHVVLTDSRELKETILSDLYQTMVLKDITRNFSIEETDKFHSLVKYLSHNIGGIISYNKISNHVNLSYQTMEKYIEALEKSYFIYRVPPYYKNKLKEITKQPKVYFIDIGLRNHIAKDLNEKKEISGEVFENYVFSELLKLGYNPKYWRTKTKTEVDFVIEKENEIIPIEVKISPQITSGVKSFIKEYSPEKVLIVNYNGHNEEKYNNELKCEEIYCDIQKMKEFLLK